MVRRLWILTGGAALLLAWGCGPANQPPTQSAGPAAADSPSPAKPDIVAQPAAESAAPDAEAVQAPESPFVLEEGFQAKTLADFEAFAAGPETWTGQGDRIVCTGKPKGYLYSKQAYQNFTWRLEYRFPRPKSLKDDAQFKGNTGLLAYITGEHKQWPICLEVQGKYVEMAAIRENGGAEPVTAHIDEAARNSARKPVGEWNRLEIVSKDGALAVSLNDVPISRSEPNFLSEGLIGIQAEDHPFEVRRLRIRAD